MKGFSATDSMNNRSDIWYTPKKFFQPFGYFDLDPCGSDVNPVANATYYDHGLEKEWFGRVWLNPPYSEVSLWLDKLSEHGKGIALVFARTDTKWAQKHMDLADSVFFLAGRIKFLDKELKQHSSAGHGSMFLSYGERPIWQFNGYLAK